ncbi:MAG: hypothetical protein J7L14_00190 [Candidatus Diapherotrites archaeon]|nr:hypothetical protein [Candidatus Diapherotrites archaeon]
MTSKELTNVYIKLLGPKTIADGAMDDFTWEFDGDYIIRHIFIKADGAQPVKSTVTIGIDENMITKAEALCNTFGTNANNALLLNIPVRRSQHFKASIKNLEGAQKDFTVELVLEKQG